MWMLGMLCYGHSRKGATGLTLCECTSRWTRCESENETALVVAQEISSIFTFTMRLLQAGIAQNSNTWAALAYAAEKSGQSKIAADVLAGVL